MDTIRLATIEEIEAIIEGSDLTPGSTILSFGADRAVVRPVIEIDPVYCESPKRKAWFISHIETWLRLNGVTAYYFNIKANEPEWKEAVEHWGAKQMSTAPELRFKKEL